MRAAVKTWLERRASDSSLLDETHMQDEINDLRAALAEKPLGPTIAELQASGHLAVSEGDMSLRDYFAAEALQGLIGGRSWDHTDDADLMARWAAGAYATADAMLAARSAA